MVSRPRRKATNAHVFRYYYATSKNLEEKDLKRALEASLEECPDSYWAEDTASCSSSEQSNANSAISSVSSSSSTASTSSSNGVSIKRRFKTDDTTTETATTKLSTAKSGSLANTKRRTSSASMQKTHLNNHNHAMSLNSNCCPKSNVHYRYKPVAKKNIYYEADFFHEGIMEYIDYELNKLRHIEGKRSTSTSDTTT